MEDVFATDNQNDQTIVEKLLVRIKALSALSQNGQNAEIFKILDMTSTIFSRNLNITDSNQLSVASDCLRIFRQSCIFGVEVQCHITKNLPVISCIHDIVNNPNYTGDLITNVSLQVLANVIINNSVNQQLIWDNFNQFLLTSLLTVNNPHKDICRMIAYNIYCVGGLIQDYGKQFLKILVQNLKEVIQHNDSTIPQFLQIFLEHFVTKQKRISSMYLTIDCSERILLLHFIADYIKENHSTDLPVTIELLQCICKEFKKKSDCVLKTEATFINSIDPKEVIALLDVITQATADKKYKDVFASDGSLFLNIGCLLRNVQALGKKSENIFSPIQKLDQIAPSSTKRKCVETDISYSLKTMLVRAIGNLAYRNEKNQNLAREMEIMIAVLDCAQMDARNPLITEWSILAIRNLCERNMENQQLIANLTKVGDADNSEILKEFNIDLGSMRIQ